MPGEQIEDDSWDGQYENIAQHIKRASGMNNHCPAASDLKGNILMQ